MYKAKDIIELKKRINKDNCTIQQFCGCFVDSEGNKLSRINSKFLTLDDEDYLKWIEIIKKLYAPKDLYNKNLYLDTAAEFDSEFFMAPIAAGEFKEDWLDRFYDDVIDTVEIEGRFLILLWLDSYDVIRRTTDGNSLDESEEVYTYIAAAICPVELDKPALAYDPKDCRFTSKDRSWEVGNPSQGFIYPAFINRSADRDRILYYTATPANPDWYIVKYLGIKPGITTAEYQAAVEGMIKHRFQERETANPDKIWMNLSYRCYLTASEELKDEESKKLYPNELKALLILDNVAEHDAEAITEQYTRTFEDRYPYYWQLEVSKLVKLRKAIAANNKKLLVLNKANTFIRDKHGTNELTGEIDKILNTERIE